EAVHGTAPDIAGKGIANPTALMMSAVMMLEWLDLREASQRMANAIQKVYGGESKVRTGDLGGSATTREFTDAIIAAL
ncbi:NAD-dependent isocitrate dehydrogenase, partial [Corallococcus sp. AB004]